MVVLLMLLQTGLHLFLVLFFSSGFLLVCWSHRERKGKNLLKPEENEALFIWEQLLEQLHEGCAGALCAIFPTALKI